MSIECMNCGFVQEDEDQNIQPREILKVTVTFAFCPKNADTWDAEIIEAINRWARTDLQTDLVTTDQGDLLCQMAATAERTNDWEHMDAFQCADGRWCHADGTIRNDVGEVA